MYSPRYCRPRLGWAVMRGTGRGTDSNSMIKQSKNQVSKAKNVDFPPQLLNTTAEESGRQVLPAEVKAGSFDTIRKLRSLNKEKRER